jgi:hypothetical protein
VRPVLYQWDGEAMRPVGRWQQLAIEQCVPGERYMLEPVGDRSMADHRHYFAWLADAWANLPEQWEGRWPDPDRLRKWALVQAGYCTTTTYRARTRDEAERYIASMLDFDDELEIERIRTRVIVKKAESQSFPAMSQRRFRESKEAVINVVSMLIGVTPQTLKRESLRHA